jgi:hypothetical protein
MYYLCIENDQITSVSTVKPNTPESILVVEVTEEEYELVCSKQTHKYDKILKKIVIKSDAELQPLIQTDTNRKARAFLKSTDWKVLRHIREKSLGQPTTLSDAEYLALEQERQQAADSIVRT